MVRGKRNRLPFLKAKVRTFGESGMKLATCSKPHVPAILAVVAIVWMAGFAYTLRLPAGLGQSSSFVYLATAQFVPILVSFVPQPLEETV